MYEPAAAGGYSFEYPHDPNQFPPSSVLDTFPQVTPTPINGTTSSSNNNIILDESLRASGISLDELSHPNNATFDVGQGQILPSHLLPEPHLNWEQPTIQTIDEQQHHHHQLQQQQQQQQLPLYDSNHLPFNSAAPTPDLLNLLHLPRSVFYDPVANLGYPGQTHLLRDLFQSLPQSYGLFSGVEEREGGVMGVGVGGGSAVVFQEDDERQFESPVFDYRREMKGEKGNFATEKHRRLQMNNKYSDLKSLIPNPTKSDRASIVMDAIDYIQELQRTVAELKLLIEKKKYGRSKRPRTENAAAAAAAAAAATANPAADVESSSVWPAGEEQEHMFNEQLRSSWLQRRSRETLVDVRIIEDEVNIKLTQKKKPNCLLLASKALDELQLDVLHISGGFIGEHYIFMFNTKILQGSSVYASAIAKKLLEVMERANPPYPLGY